MAGDDDEYEDSELGQVVNHYHSKAAGNNGTVNNVLLLCLLAIVGFLGIQLWNMNDRLARVETNVSAILTRHVP